MSRLENVQKVTISQDLQTILIINLLTYWIYFIICKLVHNGRRRVCNQQCFIALLFAVPAITCGVVAGKYFLDRNYDRNKSPAQSRDMNDDCVFLNFYDNHDLWHFVSSAAIFFSLLSILSLDDDLIDTSRDQIHIY